MCKIIKVSRVTKLKIHSFANPYLNVWSIINSVYLEKKFIFLGTSITRFFREHKKLNISAIYKTTILIIVVNLP